MGISLAMGSTFAYGLYFRPWVVLSPMGSYFAHKKAIPPMAD